VLLDARGPGLALGFAAKSQHPLSVAGRPVGRGDLPLATPTPGQPDLSLPLRRWVVAPAMPDDTASRCSLSRITRQVLFNRGLAGPTEIEAFLRGEAPHSTDPFQMRDMDRAVERLADAQRRDEVVAVYGDYDADGVTALAAMLETLAEIGIRTVSYIPNRIEEGYGLNCQALAALRERGASLVVSVDCGISNAREVEFANSLGMDVIVTDHHAVASQLPPAVAMLNPRRGDCQYPCKSLAGVGVAYKLAQALLRHLPLRQGRTATEVEEKLLDLVALGTVADMAPLLEENRQLVKRGLQALNATPRPGLQELARVAGLRFGEITASTIGYILGPRLNAAGRLHDADTSLELLLTNDRDRARALAQALESANQRRQQLTEECLQMARQAVQARGGPSSILLVKGSDYPVGVVGLVASRLVEEFYLPALVVAMGENESRGSARSIEEIDIMALLRQCDDLLTGYGGHSRAAGFTVANPNLDELEGRLAAMVERTFLGRVPAARLDVDCCVRGDELTWDVYRELEQLAPFGYGNPYPLFCIKPLRVLEARAVGREEASHLRLSLDDGRSRHRWSAIWFGMGTLVDTVKRLPHVQVAAHLRLNEWNGTSSLELQIKDLSPL